MKRKTLLLTILGLVILLIVISSISESSINWSVPDTLAGDWSGNQKVTVRYRINQKYSFVTATDSVNLSISIKDNGTVSGTFGTATFDNCKVNKNRGWIGRTLNINTDFIIKGSLVGGIFSSDTIANKEISFPFNLTANTIDGAIFQKQAIGVFPMANVQLINNRNPL